MHGLRIFERLRRLDTLISPRAAANGAGYLNSGAFICTASHDLVTPLMAVTANCDVLEAEASDRAGLASWVANIRAAADEMATRIADTLMHMGGD